MFEGFNTLIPIYIRDVLDANPALTVFILAPGGLGAFLGTAVGPNLMQRRGERSVALMALACLLIAGLLLVTAQRRTFKPVVWAFIGLVVLALLTSTLAPSVVERFWARPNEASLEGRYLARNVAMTRAAYQLDQVATVDHPGDDSVPSGSQQKVRDELATAPVWTTSTVGQAFNQLQTIRPYYQLSATSTDRYLIDGRLQQVLVAAREISPGNLPSAGSTFVNRRRKK